MVETKISMHVKCPMIQQWQETCNCKTCQYFHGFSSGTVLCNLQYRKIPPSIDDLRAHVRREYGQEAIDELHELEQKWFRRLKTQE